MSTQTLRQLPIDGRLSRGIDLAMERASIHPWSSDTLRCQLRDDVDAFVASGGIVQSIPFGVSGEAPVTLAAYQMERHGKKEGAYRDSTFY